MPHRFDPFGVGDGEPEPKGPSEFSAEIFSYTPEGDPLPAPEDIIRFAKAAGIIPKDVDSNHIMIGMVGPDGPMILGEHGPVNLGDLGERSRVVGTWVPGTPLPHTTFDDPPYLLTPEEWRQKLAANAVMADDRELFSLMMQESLGVDMIKSHKVPVDVAMDGCEEFAFALYDEFHDDASQQG
jgi:hypothetical protein